MRFFRKSWLCILTTLVLVGCQGKTYHYTDPTYRISISYPGSVDLFNDKEMLLKESGQRESNEKAIDHPQLLFALTTLRHGQITCAVHQLPEGLKLSPEEYYEDSTASELAALEADVVEPKTDVAINGKTFQMVGFTLEAEDRLVHSRIYQYLDTKSGRALVLTAAALSTDWEGEIQEMEPILQSVTVDW